MAILRRTERAMVRAMCDVKLMKKKRTEDLQMEMLGLKETMVQMVKANGVRWYGHVLRRDDGHVLRKVLEFEVKGKRKRGRLKKTWKMQVEKESKSFGLEKEVPWIERDGEWALERLLFEWGKFGYPHLRE